MDSRYNQIVAGIVQSGLRILIEMKAKELAKGVGKGFRKLPVKGKIEIWYGGNERKGYSATAQIMALVGIDNPRTHLVAKVIGVRMPTLWASSGDDDNIQQRHDTSKAGTDQTGGETDGVV